MAKLEELTYSPLQVADGLYLARAAGWSGRNCEKCSKVILREEIVGSHSESHYDGLLCSKCLYEKGMILKYVW